MLMNTRIAIVLQLWLCAILNKGMLDSCLTKEGSVSFSSDENDLRSESIRAYEYGLLSANRSRVGGGVR